MTTQQFKVGDHVRYHDRLNGEIIERSAHTHPAYERVQFGPWRLRVRRDLLVHIDNPTEEEGTQ